ncbi:ASKHA domain-containing protein [Geobacter sp. SVR]|uniref:ASKHA domain-containing protein n=1 Tax=Geobacter sp. SVR TaxID=2495594 RepID=UPI00143EFA0E|nr:ASKHA domain-containing protein [Geobacter sp. SVR]BCS55099.1 hypothetical protein GSVR_34070 [Geobacter sp. SVR]GCF85280.1 hypothetical protein GSbR_18800 [Geobacter sp. SVR]
MYALAIDLGTTTLAVSLVDLRSGRRLAVAGSLNPQRRFGADVVSRLDAAVRSEEALREMSGLARAELWRLSDGLLRDSGLVRSDVEQIAIAGNPAMQHILLGLPVRSLAFPPFRPLYTQGVRLNGSDLGWDPAAAVYLFPMPGGFVGGDTVAFLFGTGDRGLGTGNGFSQSPVPSSQALFLDLGTNGEMALVAGDDIWATAAAAGPAFEGGNLSCGMAALPGAINSVTIAGERVHCTVIGNVPPIGICGSAAIEVVSELLEKGLLESSGRLRDGGEIPSNLAARIVRHNDENAFVLHRDARHLLLLTQGDIRQIQLAKSAIRAGLDVLAERARIQCQSMQEVVLTGSFGTVLRPEWLKSVGIFDSAMVHITRFAPEGALAGVERALTEKDGFSVVERLAERFRVVPLSGTPLFETKFMENIDFPHP